jgi:hypothetical protein
VGDGRTTIPACFSGSAHAGQVAASSGTGSLHMGASSCA